MALRPVTVSQLNEYISRVLTTDPLLGNISVTGEISNLKFHSSGHVYFSMIDENSKINCFLPAAYVKNLNYALGNGLEIVVHGYINVYRKGGTYTLFVKDIEVCGEGNLSMAFELLKNRLSDEGLFDSAHKLPIPEFPKTIGIVTSETGAAVRDMIKIIKSRTKMTNIIVFPVLVQGNEAARNIAETLDMINRDFDDIDVLIVGRGGGSTEDLWAFNEEILARAVYRSQIPIISAVGHEIDFTICDFVADLRAETPTAAAEKAVPDDKVLQEKIADLKRGMLTHLENKVSYFELLAKNYINDMYGILIRKTENIESRLKQSFISLESNNPVNILNKGYAVIKDRDGCIISSSKDMLPDNGYKIYFKDGTVEITISELKREGENI